MRFENYRKLFLDYMLITIGCLLSAFAITSILKSNGLVTGGITGISIMIDKLTGVHYTYVYYSLSIAVLIFAWLTMGKKEAIKIISMSILFPITLILLERQNLKFIENDLFLAAIYYGIIGGMGCGIILKRGFSQGGTDTIAKIINFSVLPFISVSEILLVIDGLIIIASAFIYERQVALYAIISQMVFMKVVELTLFGISSKKVKIEIISDKHEEIAEYILNSIKRGISTYEIKGGYTNLCRQKTVAVCSPREAMVIRRFIAKTDSEAFVDVIPVISVWGKGVGFESILEEANS